MRTLVLRWVCLLGLSLLLFWFGHLIRRSSAPPAPRSSGLRGYVRILPGSADQFLDLHCSQCALVSSSGQMLGAGAGEEIDSTGCVIRMNNAPTLGYERDVGNRTRVRVVSHTSVPLLLRNERYYFRESANTTYVFWGPDRNMRRDGKGRVFNALLRTAQRFPAARLYAVTGEKVQFCDNVFQNETGKNRMKTGAFLSTGFFTMILALDMCDSVHVYGMISDGHCSRANHSVAPYHYYEQDKADECRMYRAHEGSKRGGHRFITEKAIYAKWAARHKMDFRHPSWRL